MRDSIAFNNNPTKDQLTVIMNHKRFKQTPTNFQNAVRGKLKAYDAVPTAIEKTMSPAQYTKPVAYFGPKGLSIEAIYLFAYLVPILASENVPLTDYMGVEAIRIIFILEEKLGRNDVADECIDEFMSDCKNGMKPLNALEKQLRKLNSLERT